MTRCQTHGGLLRIHSHASTLTTWTMHTKIQAIWSLMSKVRTHIMNQEGQSMTKVVIEEFEWIWCLHGLPLWIISNPQGQEYGSSAVQGAVLNLPAVCIGRHHCRHTPWWPGAQHMVGCWEYTAMRPRRLSEPCMPRYTSNIHEGIFHNDWQTPKLSKTNIGQSAGFSSALWSLKSKVRTHIQNQEGQSMIKVVIEEFEWIWCLHGLPLWIISNPQGQEYGSSAVQGAVLNLPAVCIGRHHCGHTPWWPGAKHMVGCWEYTAMRPRWPREPCTLRYRQYEVLWAKCELTLWIKKDKVWQK